MSIEKILHPIGFKKGKDLASDYFIHFYKKGDHIFIYKDSIKNEVFFSSPSGDLTGNLNDLITFFYESENSSKFNEADRIDLFKRQYPLATSLKTEETLKLKGVLNFNLYQVMLKGISKAKDQILHNCFENDKKMYFLFMDEEKNKGNSRNILGVISYDKETKTENQINFSDLSKSIYFSNPSIKTNQAIIFNSFKEMLALKERMVNPFFYVVFKNKFNTNKAKTIALLSEAKQIEKTCLAFADNLEGYERDIEYLSVFAGVEMKKKSGFYKLSITQSKKSDLFVKRIKDFKQSVEVELEGNLVKNLVTIKIGKDLKGKPTFTFEIPQIANIVKGFLVLMTKYLILDTNYKIVKPKGVYWSEEKTNIKNISTEFKLNIFDTIKETYQFN